MCPFSGHIPGSQEYLITPQNKTEVAIALESRQTRPREAETGLGLTSSRRQALDQTRSELLSVIARKQGPMLCGAEDLLSPLRLLEWLGWAVLPGMLLAWAWTCMGPGPTLPFWGAPDTLLPTWG